MIELSTVTRNLVDTLNQQHDKDLLSRESVASIELQIEAFLHDLPAYFGLETRFAEPLTSLQKRVECERWLIHQQVFDLYLKLHAFDPDGFDHPSLVYLAHHVLRIQDKIFTRCRVFDQLRLNYHHVTQAAYVIMLQVVGKGDHFRLARTLAIDEVRHALSRLQIRIQRGGLFKAGSDELDGLLERFGSIKERGEWSDEVLLSLLNEATNSVLDDMGFEESLFPSLSPISRVQA